MAVLRNRLNSGVLVDHMATFDLAVFKPFREINRCTFHKVGCSSKGKPE